MNSRLRRIVLSLALLALVATGCSSSSDDAAAAVETSDESDDNSSNSATSIPVPETDSAANDAIAGLDGDDEGALVTATQNSVRALFNIDPSADALQCIADQAPADPILNAALRNPATSLGQIANDEDLKALSNAVNGCVDTLSLGDWATEVVGSRGDVLETAPPCFAERFDGENGDRTFSTLVALNYQFRIEPEGVSELIDTFVDCTPISSLTEFFASQGEAISGFTTAVDRPCLTDELNAPDVSRNFWTAFIEGLQPPTDIIDR